MTTLIPSLVVRPCCVNCGARDSSKLVAATHYICGNKVAHGLEKMDLERKEILGVVAQNATRNCFRNINWKVSATSHIAIEETENRYSTTEIEELESRLNYLFLTEIGGQVKVIVGKKNKKYIVSIEVSSLQLYNSDNKLILSWGVFRSNSSCFMPVDFQNSVPEVGSNTTEIPFMERSSGSFALKLDFEANHAPFYLSFLLKSTLDTDLSSSDIRSHRKTNFCIPVGFGRGYPAPLGLSFSSDGSPNFAFFSRNAGGVVLCLYDGTSDKPALEIDLDPYVNRTGDIWHASMESVGSFVSYGYRCKEANLQDSGETLHTEHVHLDPYAKLIRNSFSDDHGLKPQPRLGELQKEPAFNWNDDVHPYIPMEKLVVYRLNVMHFTKDESSQVASDLAGTFSGLMEKLHHFKDLGVNAVLLEPIFSFDEQKGPYFPFHFFSPMNVYGPSSGPVSTINSVKEMVKRLHANGIEVLLEVVFTHTAESGALQGIDDSCYYYVNGDADLGIRNALNCNYSIVQQMIVDSLRYWVTEFHVDGFCFINASSLLRGFHGEYLSRPPLVETIAFDPLLSKTKIIADCWDPRNMLPKEIRFPHWKRWAEVNTRFCNDVRNFLRGEGLSDFATRLCGSGDIFMDGRGPAFSFNFTTKNFGLPLVDLVSFSSSELASELSWNCGEEGPTNKTTVLERRLKQIRNFLFILYVSLGVPILNMGDECGQSSGGSPAYGDRKPFNWNSVKTGFGIQTIQFISFLSSLRSRRSDLLQRRSFLKEESIDWHGSDQSPPRWDDPSSKFLAMTLKAENMEGQLPSESSSIKGDLFIAFNTADCSVKVILPPPPTGMVWHRLVDTALPFPGFFTADGEAILKKKSGLVTYKMESHSCALFEANTLDG